MTNPSATLAQRLAKYAYDDSSPRAKRKEWDGPAEAGPSTPTRSGRRSTSSSKRFGVDAGDEQEESPVAIRKRSGSTRSPGSGKKPRPFASPELYAHLKPVTDHLKPDLNSG